MGTEENKPKPLSTAQKMLERKRQIEAYIVSGDESKKPAGVKFVKPFTLSPERN